MHADSADISSTDILKRGQPLLWNDGFRGFCATAMRDLLIVKTKVKILCLAAALSFLAVAAPEPAAKRGAAFATVPKQALVELKATVGKPFSAGLVFVNGKFIDPPYKVERYGTALRINGIQVTNEIIPWTEFLKTQAGARVEKVDPPPAAATPAPVQETAPAVEEPATSDASIDDIDDLFDDDPKPKKKVAAKPAPVKRPPKAAPPPQPTTTVVLDGEFVAFTLLVRSAVLAASSSIIFVCASMRFASACLPPATPSPIALKNCAKLPMNWPMACPRLL